MVAVSFCYMNNQICTGNVFGYIFVFIDKFCNKLSERGTDIDSSVPE